MIIISRKLGTGDASKPSLGIEQRRDDDDNTTQQQQQYCRVVAKQRHKPPHRDSNTIYTSLRLFYVQHTP